MTLKQRHFINLHKILTPFVILLLMQLYQNYSIGPLIYFGLHTGYCICWLLKEIIYPDKSFEQEIPLVEFWFALVFISLYWVAPWMLISSGVVPRNIVIMLAIPTFLVGFLFHFGADAQKYFVLKQRKGLITDGFFARTRNPNYVGETLIYLGFGSLSESVIPIIILLAMVMVIFYPGMVKKDKSMARYQEFAEYQTKTNIFFPKML